ncbi:DUF4381 domain-containing protein [Shewanella waksmanii]|uniref:DUF4381 domain-containing protein n=1 Tax=Shewanella waksmanii TaxID=213783 RepID=UPI003736108E
MVAATNPALANLRDIQLPQAIHQWPIAPGYWLLLAAVVILLLWCLRLWKKRQHKLAAKRMAIKELSQMNTDMPHLPIEVNSLIKRAVMSYLGRDSVAKLEGQRWLDWLLAQQASPQLISLIEKRYQNTAYSPEDKQRLLDETKQWLSQTLPLTKGSANV